MRYFALFLAFVIAAAPMTALGQQHGGGRPSGGGRPAGGGGGRPAGGGGTRPAGVARPSGEGGGFNFNHDTAPSRPPSSNNYHPNTSNNYHPNTNNNYHPNTNNNYHPNTSNNYHPNTNNNYHPTNNNYNRTTVNNTYVSRGNHTYYNASGTRVSCNNCTFVRNPVYGGGAVWGWNRGVAWYPAPAYWGGGFWGAMAIGVTSAAVFGAIVANNTRYTSYQIMPSSPGATLLNNYHLTQTPCGPPNLVVIFGPNNSVICAYPNDIVAPGSYNLDTSTLSLVSQ
jgi:hypothetical protein